MRSQTFLALGTALLLGARSSAAVGIDLDLTSSTSIKRAASSVAHTMMSWYIGDQAGQVPGYLTPSVVPGLYYWWEGGSMFGTLIDYWYYTGDSTYNDIVTEALLYQVGPSQDFMPPNQTKDEGNDDQVFWGFAVMTAAEYKFPNPPADQPQWLALAQGVWNSQQLRWDTTSCNGGLRWQIFAFNRGYDYKNTPSNAGFVNLGARLYAYTGNETYGKWTAKVWDWMDEVNLITGTDNPPAYRIFDGTYTTDNCPWTVKIQWSYNVAMLLNAAAVMWNVTQDPLWEERATGIWQAAIVFFRDQVMLEAACEPRGNCNTDQLSFKSVLSRMMAASTKWMPQLYEEFQPYLAASATAAAQQCSGEWNGFTNVCGFKWIDNSTWDGTYGFGQQMNALEVIQANLISGAAHPVTAQSGGISKGDPTAGTQGDGGSLVDGVLFRDITTGDKAGAGVLTAFVLVVWLCGVYWMI